MLGLKRNILRRKLLPPLMVALAALYIFSIAVNDVVHPLLHYKAEYNLHTAENEQDPCHRAIYHGEKEHSADHHSHVLPVIEKCWLCDIILSHEYLRAEQLAFTKTSFTTQEKTFVLPATSSGLYTLPLSRGPPLSV